MILPTPTVDFPNPVLRSPGLAGPLGISGSGMGGSLPDSPLSLPALPVFPSFIGLAWPVVRAPSWDTLVQTAYNGKETRIPRRANAIYDYQIDIVVLRMFSPFDFQQAIGFVNSMKGQFGLFNFDDITDDTVTNQAFGTGDSVTSQFQLYRTLGGANDIIQSLQPPGPIIYVNNIAVSTANYSIDSYGVVTFVSPPALNAALTWSGKYYWYCRFTIDAFAFSQFMSQMFELKKLTFKTVLF